MKQNRLISPKDFEGTISKRMKKMDLSYFLLILTSYKTMQMIHIKNPLYKYLCHFIPYAPKKNNEIKEPDNEKENKLEPLEKKSLKTEENLIEFNLKHVRDLQRFQKFEMKIINEQYKKKVLFIQKHIRSFLKRIHIIRLIYSVMIRNCLKSILKIQKFYKKFAYKRNFKINFFTDFIINYRKDKSNILKDLLYTYEVKLQIKNQMFISQILKQRLEKVSFIQNYYLNKKYREKVLNYAKFERNKYILFYPYYAKKVQIKILIDKKLLFYKNFDFNICPIRKMFVLHIDYSELESKKYYCQLFADNNFILDQRFPSLQWKDNQYYNIIGFYKRGIENIPSEISEIEEEEKEEKEKEEEKEEEKDIINEYKEEEKKENLEDKNEILVEENKEKVKIEEEKKENEVKEIKEEETKELKKEDGIIQENVIKNEEIKEEMKEEKKEEIKEDEVKKDEEKKVELQEEKSKDDEIKKEEEKKEKSENEEEEEESEEEKKEETKIEEIKQEEIKKEEIKKEEEKKEENKKEESEDEEEEESEEENKEQSKKEEEKKEESEDEEEEDES